MIYPYYDKDKNRHYYIISDISIDPPTNEMLDGSVAHYNDIDKDFVYLNGMWVMLNNERKE